MARRMYEGPSSVDRRHVLALNGRAEIPKTGGVNVSSTLRYMSGAPFSIFNSAIDADQNGELNDPSPAGTYSGTAPDSMHNVKNDGGRNGAVGPDYFQLDLRAGWRRRIRGEQALELFLDIFNVCKVLDLKPGAGPVEVDLYVERGQTATLKVVDPDGKPLGGAAVAGLTQSWPVVFAVPTDSTTVYALDDKPRTVMLLHPEKKLGGVVEGPGELRGLAACHGAAGHHANVSRAGGCGAGPRRDFRPASLRFGGAQPPGPGLLRGVGDLRLLRRARVTSSPGGGDQATR